MLNSDPQRTALKALLEQDPATLGFNPAVLSDQQVLDALNVKDQSRPRTSVQGIELFKAIAPTELDSLTTPKAELLRGLIGRDDIDPTNSAIRSNLQQIFPPPTFGLTRANLLALENEAVSWLELQGLPQPTLHQIAVALGRN